MPYKCKLRVKMIAGRNLPVMDKAADTTDAYVELKLGNITHKTDVYRKSLNPQWNSDWFKFEVPDKEIQDEPLQIRLMDHDTYSANDAIGKVYININPLLCSQAYSNYFPTSSPPFQSTANANLPDAVGGSSSSGHNIATPSQSGGPSTMTGWIPVYDTMLGLRGEVLISVKLDLVSEFKKTDRTSVGIHFFSSTQVPSTFRLLRIAGLVEEAIINDDPEHEWIDKIRSPRNSNEARQTLFCKLTGILQRKIGCKTIAMGGNAVLGYRQCVDLEGETGIVVRGLGTAVELVPSTCNAISPLVGATDVPRLHQQGQPSYRNPYMHYLPCPQSILERVEHNIGSKESLVVSSESIGVVEDRVAALSCSPDNKFISKLAGGYHSRRKPLPVERNEDWSECKGLDGADRNCFEMGSLEAKASPLEGVVVTEKTRKRSQSSHLLPQLNETRKIYENNMYVSPLAGRFPVISKFHLKMLYYPYFTISKLPKGVVKHLGPMVSCQCVKLINRQNEESENDTHDSWWSQVRDEILLFMKTHGCNVVLGYTENMTIYDDICVLYGKGTAALIREGVTRNSLSKIPCFEDEADNHPQLPTDNHFRERKSSLNIETCTSHTNSSDTPCSIFHHPQSKKKYWHNKRLFRCGVCKTGKVYEMQMMTVDPPDSPLISGSAVLVQARACRYRTETKSGEVGAKDLNEVISEVLKDVVCKMHVKVWSLGMNAVFKVSYQYTIGEKMVVAVMSGTAMYINTFLPPPKKFAPSKGTPSFHLGSTEDDESEQQPLQRAEEEIEISDYPSVESRLPIVTTSFVPGDFNYHYKACAGVQMFSKVFRENFATVPIMDDMSLNAFFDEAIQSVCFRLAKVATCAAITDVKFDVSLPSEDEMQVCIVGAVTRCERQERENSEQNKDSELIFPIDELGTDISATKTKQNTLSCQQRGVRHVSSSSSCGSKNTYQDNWSHLAGCWQTGVFLTPSVSIPGGKVDRYIGYLNFFFIRETMNLKDFKGVSDFSGTLVTEVLGLVRAHVVALGGNAVTSFFMNEFILDYNPNNNKNQSQILINVGGDAVVTSPSQG